MCYQPLCWLFSSYLHRYPIPSTPLVNTGMGSLFTGRHLNIVSCLPVYGRLCFALLNRKLQANLHLQDEKALCPSSWCLHDLGSHGSGYLGSAESGENGMHGLLWRMCVAHCVHVWGGWLPNGLEVRRLPRRGDPDLRLMTWRERKKDILIEKNSVYTHLEVWKILFFKLKYWALEGGVWSRNSGKKKLGRQDPSPTQISPLAPSSFIFLEEQNYAKLQR